MKEIKISNIELGMLTMGVLYGSTAIMNPTVGAKRDAWIAVILGWIIGVMILCMHWYISKLNHRKTLMEMLEICFGKVLGKAVGVLYILFFIYKAAVNTRAFGEFMAVVSYPETPLIFLISLFILSGVYLVRSGLEVIGKVAEILVPMIPIPILVISSSALTVPGYTELQPVLLELAPVIKSIGNIITTLLGDFVVFLMIIPYTNKAKGRLKAAFWGLTSFMVLLMIISIRNLRGLGPGLLENFSYPAHVAAQMIPGINIDPLIDINLLLGGGFKVAVFLYAATRATAELFGLDGYKPLVSAFAVFVIVVAFWIAPNEVVLRHFGRTLILNMVPIPFQIIFPLFMLVISMVRRRKKNRQSSVPSL